MRKGGGVVENPGEGITRRKENNRLSVAVMDVTRRKDKREQTWKSRLGESWDVRNQRRRRRAQSILRRMNKYGKTEL